jgi:hypothetical protein
MSNTLTMFNKVSSFLYCSSTPIWTCPPTQRKFVWESGELFTSCNQALKSGSQPKVCACSVCK